MSILNDIPKGNEEAGDQSNFATVRGQRRVVYVSLATGSAHQSRSLVI